ncbi:hypothetical protein C8R46DRAFT_1215354 [Mycena filopes]|nr:hypothetical protein C8R46DRAFT_1215349 [Mycena filopes]KAJ7173408.1 hypothetical protein C8R46DRAFT_1215354 [Mycena filopes]
MFREVEIMAVWIQVQFDPHSMCFTPILNGAWIFSSASFLLPRVHCPRTFPKDYAQISLGCASWIQSPLEIIVKTNTVHTCIVTSNRPRLPSPATQRVPRPNYRRFAPGSCIASNQPVNGHRDETTFIQTVAALRLNSKLRKPHLRDRRNSDLESVLQVLDLEIDALAAGLTSLPLVSARKSTGTQPGDYPSDPSFGSTNDGEH